MFPHDANMFWIWTRKTLIPVDFKRAGHILDDDLYTHLVRKMRAGVNVTVLMDCCHSGSALDLPYEINATQSAMSFNQGFNAGLLDEQMAAMCCLGICAFCLLDSLMDSIFESPFTS
jgi:hypothetical protein